MKIGKKKFYKANLLLQGVLIGMATGLTVSAFRLSLDWAESLREKAYVLIGEESTYAFFWFLFLAVVALCLKKIIAFDSLTGASGIPQVKCYLRGTLPLLSLKGVCLKFIGCVLAIGSGLSLGRQGPSIQFGAALGGVVKGFWKRKDSFEDRPSLADKRLVTMGAGAGLAAAFNAPLAGVLFSLEELSGNWSSMSALLGIVSSAVAAAVAEMLLGSMPVFNLTSLPALPPSKVYLCFIMLGLFCGLLGLMFHHGLLFSMNTWDKYFSKFSVHRYLLPLMTAGALGFCLPEILSGGEKLVNTLLIAKICLPFLLLLFVAKFIFTLLCFGAGNPGGIFLPMMALGAASGAIFAQFASALFGFAPDFTPHCIVFGMAGFFAGVTKTPISCSVLIMELTGTFDHILILLCVTLAATLVLDMTGTPPIYDAIVARNKK